MKRQRRSPRGKSKRRPTAPPTGEISIAAFARDRNVDEKAVRKGIASERIPPSCVGLSRTGRKQVITDLEGARRAWDANAARVPLAPAVNGARQSLSEASTLAALERHRKLRIDNDLREGLIVTVKAAKRAAFEDARIIREILLNLPPRLAAELAAETDPAKVFARLDEAIREALGDVADRLEASGE
jgi:hypothetical protein